MTEFSEQIHISIDSLHNHYILPVSDGLETFLINSSRNSVSSIQVSDQKIVQTWTLPQPDCFTSPIAFWAENSSICCVVEHKKLLMWKTDSESLKSAEKIKLTEPVFAVIPLKEESPLIVFCNGAVSFLTSIQDSNSVASCRISVDEKLIWADATIINNVVIIVQLTFKEKTKSYKLQHFLLKDGVIDETSVTCISLEQGSSCLKGYCFNKKAKQHRFLTIWDNGDVFAYSLDEAAPELLFKVHDVNNTTIVQIDALGASHLAVAKYQGSCAKNEGVIEAWDLKYHVLIAKKLLKQLCSQNFQMKSLASSIFLSSNDGVIMVPVLMEASTLSAVVGKLNTTAKSIEGKTFSWSNNEKDKDEVAISEDISSSSSAINTQIQFEELGDTPSVEEIKLYCKQLTQSSDISEKELIKILKSVLSKKDSKRNKDAADVKAMLLNAIFKVSFSDIFLRQHLKELTFSETLTVLENLLRILDYNVCCTKDSEWPTDLQIVNWIQLIIQVHFEELLLSPDKKIRQLLGKLLNSLATKMDIYDELEQIRYLLMLTQKKKNILPDKSKCTMYHIENHQL